VLRATRRRSSPSSGLSWQTSDGTLPVAQRREFKWYCRLASHLAGDDLKNELEARARADDSVVARRARLVLGAIVRKQKPNPQD
jgi:hypothetical protein